MSVASEISRIQADRDIIRAELVELGIAQSADNLDKLAVAMEGIENHGAVSATVQGGETYPIPKGYHNGSGAVYGSGDSTTYQPGDGVTFTETPGGTQINVETPVKHLTRAEYAALTEEEKQADVLHLVEEPPWEPVPLAVQEYDTEDGWHIRKWSNGEIEASRREEVALDPNKVPIGPFVFASASEFQIPEEVKTIRVKNYWADMVQGGTWGFVVSNLPPNEAGNLYVVTNSSAVDKVALSAFVAGRWK